jgi:iron complex outermembrane receptor protein
VVGDCFQTVPLAACTKGKAMPRPLSSLKHFAVSFFVVASAAIQVHSVYAQTPDVSGGCAVATSASQATLSGFVSDPSGAMLHDAFITLSCGAVKLQATTDATGRYSFQLAPGTYNLTVAAKGFATKEQSLKVSGVGNNSQDLVLNVAQENSTIEVRAGANGYEVNESNEATRTDTPIREIPQAVYVDSTATVA